MTSSAKKKRIPGDARLSQTPEGSFLDYQRNCADALRAGGVSVPEVRPPLPLLWGLCADCPRTVRPQVGSSERYLAHGPAAVVRMHPAMGPLFGVTAQKVRGGRLEERCELELELAEADVEGLQLTGSLLVQAGAHAAGLGFWLFLIPDSLFPDS